MRTNELKGAIEGKEKKITEQNRTDNIKQRNALFTKDVSLKVLPLAKRFC
jgi:hypothetical protein